MKNELEEMVALWQRDNVVRNLSADSIETYGASARDFLAFFNGCGLTKIRQITSGKIEDYIIAQRERGCAARTINNRLKALRRLMNFYQEKHKPTYRPPEIVLQRETCTSRGPLTDAEVCRLIRRFTPHDRNSVLAAFILDTGVRSKSVRNVRVDDVDLADGRVTIRVTKNRDPLVLPLSSALRKLLAAYIEAEKLEGGYLFPNRKGGRLYDRSSVYKAVGRYLRKCGIAKSGVHLFRYTFGKIMVENNCNAMLLQKWMGHRTMEETKKYVRLYSDELKEACEYVTPLSEHGKIFKKMSPTT